MPSNWCRTKRTLIPKRQTVFGFRKQIRLRKEKIGTIIPSSSLYTTVPLPLDDPHQNHNISTLPLSTSPLNSKALKPGQTPQSEPFGQW